MFKKCLTCYALVIFGLYSLLECTLPQPGPATKIPPEPCRPLETELNVFTVLWYVWYGSIAVQTTHLILNCSSFLSSFWLHTGQRIVTFALNSIWTECVLFTVTHLCCMCVLCIKPDNNTKDTFRKNKNTKLKESLLCVQSQMTKCDLYVLQVRAQRTCVCRTHFVEVGTLHLIRTQGFDVHH